MKTIPDDASDDQTGNIPTGYYRRNTGMLHMLQEDAGKSPPKALTDEQLQDKDFLRAMCTRELATIVHNNGGKITGVQAINTLWDRIDGKAPQSVTMTVQARLIDKMTAEDLIEYRNFKAAQLGMDPLIVPPMPVIIDN